MIRRPPTLACHGMVVASHPLAVEAGVAALRAGGHAVDAAIAAAAVLSVVEPAASGLGGDAFFLIYDRKDRAVSAINGNGAAPSRLERKTFAGQTSIPPRGPLSMTVPGCVAAWGEAHYGWGRLDWDGLIQPAVTLADEGFPVSWRLARVLKRELALLQADPGLAGLFLKNGAPLAAGETCRPKVLAKTLAHLGEDGAEVFYTGPIAKQFCTGVQDHGGCLDLEDLASHDSALLQPIEFALGDWMLFEQPLPTQGILLPLMLGMLSELEPSPPWVELHRQIQAARIALAARQALISDPSTLPAPADEVTAFLLDARTRRALAQLLDQEPIEPSLVLDVVVKVLEEVGPDGAALLRAYRSRGFLGGRTAENAPGGDTTYLCTADAEGNVAGLIQSIFHPFGCGFLETSTGIIPNCRASGFSLDPRNVNCLEPGKHPMHTLNSYLVVKDDLPWLVGGTPGANQQVQTNLQVLRHLRSGHPLWTGPPPMVPQKWTQTRAATSDARQLAEPDLLAAALEAPRWGLEQDGPIRLEGRFAAEITRRLRHQGHDLVRVGPWEGSGFVQAIRRLENGVLLGATDPRGEGLALGF